MSTFSPPGGEFAASMQEPQRTSVAAILSLVCGILSFLVCCIPIGGSVVAIVGLLLAVVAFIAIGRSDGRVGGRGAAIGGLAISIVVLFLNIAYSFGAMSILPAWFKPYGEVIAVAQSDDTTKLTETLSSSATAAATPESIAAFRQTSIDSLGKFQDLSPGLLGWFKSFEKLGKAMPSVPAKYQPSGGGTTVLPLNGEFEKGSALIIVILNQREQSSTARMGRVENIAVVPDGGTPIWLIDPSGP